MATTGLPPPPINDAPGSFTWLEWYRQLRNYISTSGSVPWYIINFADSNLSDIQNRDHNVLTNIQGGTAGERYHLTAAQWATLGDGDHNDLANIQGGSSTERYHLTEIQSEKITTVPTQNLVGRYSAGTGEAQFIKLGTNLSISGDTLNAAGGGSGSAIPVSDEGTQLTAGVTSFNFTGTGVTATAVGNAVTVNVPLTEGPVGPTGPAGTAATIAVGTTTTGNPGTNAAVTNSGTSSAAVFNFTIPRGDVGATGAQGPQGIQGEVGPQGPQGVKGDTGDTGPKGDTGDTGATGPTGPKGDTGDTGPQGPQGIQGETGPQGPIGPEGPEGPQPPLSANLPIMDGTASAGVGTEASKSDHVHPSDTSKLNLTGGTMTGTIDWNQNGGTGSISIQPDPGSPGGTAMDIVSPDGMTIRAPYLVLDSDAPVLTMPGPIVNAPIIVAGIDALGGALLGYGVPSTAGYVVSDTHDANVIIKTAAYGIIEIVIFVFIIHFCFLYP